MWVLRADRPAEGPRRFDLGGSALYGAAIIALVGSFSLLPHAASRAWGSVFLIGGIAGLAAFIWLESRLDHPVLAIGLFRGNPVFVFSNLAALINYLAAGAVGVLLSLYLQHLKGVSAGQAGLILLTQPALMALFSPFAGRLSDRIQPRVVASLGMAAVVAGLIALSVLTSASPIALVIAALALMGVGFAFFSSPNTNAVMSSVPQTHYAVATAILSTMRLAGHALSNGLMVLLFSLYMGTAKLDRPVYPQFEASLRIAFPVLAGLGLLGIFASLARGKLNREAGSPESGAQRQHRQEPRP
jgi:MFS family permease